jgi:uncharacterized protein (DUF433 family)
MLAPRRRIDMTDMDELLVDPATYRERIVRNPNILVGKPTVKGTRISVELVLHFLAHDPNLDELFAAYPRLTVEDVKAVLAYARAVVVGQEPVARPLVKAESALAG